MEWQSVTAIFEQVKEQLPIADYDSGGLREDIGKCRNISGIRKNIRPLPDGTPMPLYRTLDERNFVT